MQGRAGCLQDGQFGGRHAGAGPAAGDRALGGAAAVRAVVDVPDQLAAQCAAQHELMVAGETGDARAAPGLHDGQGGTRAFHLAGCGGQQLPCSGEVHAQDGGDLVGGEPVAHGEFERLALLRGGPGGLRPCEQGEFTAPLLLQLLGEGRLFRLGASHRVRALTFLLGLGELAQTGPAGQRVEPGAAVSGGLRRACATAFGQRQHVPQGGGRGVVVAEHGQAVREQAVEIRLVARGRALRQRARRPAVTRLPMRPVCAGGAGRGLRTAAHHPCDRRRPVMPPSAPLSTFNPYG